MINDRLKKGLPLFHKEHLVTGDLIISNPEITSDEIFLTYSDKLKKELPFPLYTLGKVLFFSKLHFKYSFDDPKSYDDFLSKEEEEAEAYRLKLVEQEKEKRITRERLDEKRKRDDEEKASKKRLEEKERINALIREKSKVERLNILLQKNTTPGHASNYTNSLIVYLNTVYSDLCQSIETTECFCELKKLNKSYSSKFCQQYYFLRYSYGYSFEYKKMFEKALNCFEGVGSLKVLSIGCGCGIDYWALTEALIAKDAHSTPIYYDGVDPVDWSMKFLNPPERNSDSVNYHLYKIEDFITAVLNFVLEYDIIIFPMSLTDLHPNTYKELSTLFKKCTLRKNIIVLMCSYPSNGSSREDENSNSREIRNKQKFNALISELNIDESFRRSNDCCYPAEMFPITALDKTYERYPNDIQYALTNEINCSQKNFCPRTNDLCDFSKNPVTTGRNISNSIICFERKENDSKRK